MAKLKDLELKDSSEKKKKKKKKYSSQNLGLFDHVNQITKFRDPDYFDNLTDGDKKSFDHFIILKALSMNPALLDRVKVLYQYFDIISPKIFYKLLISYIPADSTYYPWIKSKKRYKEELIKMVSKRFEVSNKDAKEYISLLSLTEEGVKSLIYICQEFGKSEKEIEELLSNNNDNE